MTHHDPSAPGLTGQLRVGFVSLHDPADPRSLSGMPHAMHRSLSAEGLDVVDLGRLDHDSAMRRDLLGRASRRSLRLIDRLRTWTGFDEASQWHRRPDAMERRFESRCRTMAARLARAIDRHRPAVLFGNCISSPLAFLSTRLPIVYTGDATAEIIAGTYPRFSQLGARYAACTDRIERLALSKVRFAAFASPPTRASAVDRYDLPEERALVVPFGANLVPGDRHPPAIPADPPSRTDLRLTITAVDPDRKQVALAIQATRVLRDRGWNALLAVIGPRPRGAVADASARFMGLLDPSSASHLAAHRQAIAESHLCLQPSLGEAYGIAPIESAAFGKPAIVADVGGLPFVVRDGETGVVVPRSVDAAGLADAIESIARDPDRYRRMSEAAHARHQRELNWSAWGRQIASLLRLAAAEHDRPPGPTTSDRS